MTRRRYARVQRSCARCVVNTTRGTSKVCDACKAAGYRWCGSHRNVVPVIKMARYNSRLCQACCLASQRRTSAKRRPQPPAGYVRLTTVAQRLHWSSRWLAFRAARGDFGNTVWQAHPRGAWYIRHDVEVTQ